MPDDAERVKVGQDTVRPLLPDEALIPEERHFRIGEREIILRPLTIGMFKRVGRDLGAVTQQVVEQHPDIDLGRPETHLPVIFPIVAEAFSRILGQLFGMEPEYIDEHLPIHQAVEIIKAAIEINRIPEIRRNLALAWQMARSIPRVT